MIDSGQLMERFRHLSRDIQNELQNAQKYLDKIKKNNQDSSDLTGLDNSLLGIFDAWQDYAGWILLSTLDDIEEAKANCAPGLINLKSKIFITKKRMKNQIATKGIKIDLNYQRELNFETYIPYLEQLLDLIISNAVKYSPNSGAVDIVFSQDSGIIKIIIQSIGPTVHKHEAERLGDKGFRSESARKMSVTGQGYGLYNVKRLCALIGGSVQFRPDSKVLFHNERNIPYSNFTVAINLPETPLKPL